MHVCMCACMIFMIFVLCLYIFIINLYGMYVFLYVCMYVRTYVCMYVCMYDPYDLYDMFLYTRDISVCMYICIRISLTHVYVTILFGANRPFFYLAPMSQKARQSRLNTHVSLGFLSFCLLNQNHFIF